MKKIMRIVYSFVPLFFLVVSGIQAQEMAGVDQLSRTVEIIGGTLSYDFETNVIDVLGESQFDPTVAIDAQTITAKSIQFDSSSRILHASGAVRFWDRGNILRGDRLDFDVDKKVGELRGLKSSELMDNIYFSGERLEIGHRTGKIPKGATAPAQVPEYTLHDGLVTSNPLPVPFYHIKYDRLVFSPEVRASAYNAVFVAQEWPLFYAPYLSKSLAEHEVTYFMNIDHYSDLGFAWMNRVMWRPNNEWTINVFGDYYTDAGIGKGLKVNMDLPGEYGPKGEIYGYHIKQEAPDNDRIYDGEDRYNLSMEYEQDLPWDMRLTAKGHKFSDSEYRWDYEGPEHFHMVDLYDIDRDAVSHVNLSKWWDDQSLRTTFATRLDEYYYSGLPFIERKPQVHFEQYPVSLFGTPIYAELQADYGRYRREEGLTFPLNETTLFNQTRYYDEVDRLDLDVRVAYPIHLPKRFTLRPWLGLRATNYMDPMRAVGNPILPNEFDDETRAMLEGGIDLSTRSVYEFEPFLDRYARMRAVVEPILQYAYYHPNKDLEEITTGANVRFPYIDPVDDFRFKMHRISAMVRSRIQGKTAEGISGDFMRLNAGFEFDYVPDGNLVYDNLEYFDDRSNNNDHRFSDLIEDFNIYPFDWLTFGNTTRYDIDDSELRSTYTFAEVQPIDPLRFSVGYLTFDHPDIDNKEQRDVTLNVNWKLSNKYYMYYSSWLDIDESVFRRNYVGIVRDLYDFYGVIQFGYRRHPTLGDDFRISFGIQFWGIGKQKKHAAPVLFY